MFGSVQSDISKITSTIPDPIIDNRNVYLALVKFDKETMGDVAFRALWIAYE